MKDYDVLNELIPKTQELHRAIFDKGYEQGQKDILEQLHYEDCISRKAAIDAMIKLEQDDIKQYGCSIPEGFNSEPAIEALKGLLPVAPNKKIGKWIGDRCSNCGNERAWHGDNPKFCPDCGARMIESQESEDKE